MDGTDSRRSVLIHRLPTALRRSSLSALAVLAIVAAGRAPARASIVNLNTCNTSVLSEAFAPWADPAFYELSPGGDFELSPGGDLTSSSWTLDGGAQLVPGSEPYAATGTLGSSSLSLPAGSSAQSPPTCVDAAYPTFRFFIAGTGAVAVSVVDGGASTPAGVAVAGGAWLPTPLMVTGSALWAAGSGGTAQVSLRLTALSGDPHVDDVFIDPWNRG